MILEAILLTVAEISADGEAKLPVAIFPQMQIDTGIHRDGVSITSPTTNSQVRLTGIWTMVFAHIHWGNVRIIHSIHFLVLTSICSPSVECLHI